MFNIKLKAAIAASGLKQNYIARMIGVSEKTLSNAVNGHTALSPEALRKLARVLKRPQWELQ